MNLTLRKIQLHELEDFVNSKTFREFEFVPISPIRAKSYIKNPHALPDDIVLYLGFIENRLIAFRSLFADVVNSDDKQIRFGWCSGSWVHPNFRRQGFSTQLLEEAYTDWNQKLMFTNYTPNSEKTIQKTGWFKTVHQFEGARVYLFPKTKKLISKANSNRLFELFFSLIDIFIWLYSSIRLRFFTDEINAQVKFENLDFPDEQCYQLLNKKSINRGKKELQFIFDNPWISSQKSEIANRYPFSTYSDSFYYKTVKVFSEDKFLGFFIFSVREGHLKTLFWNLPDGLEEEIARYLKVFCKNNKIEMASIYKKELAAELFKRKYPFLRLKKYGQKVYCTFELERSRKIEFQDGDGDVIFT